MLTQDIKDIINGRIIMKDGRTVDQIYKGFQIYKSGKAPAEFTAIKENDRYQGSMDDVKNKIDKYWEKKDAEEVLKKTGDEDKYKNPMKPGFKPLDPPVDPKKRDAAKKEQLKLQAEFKDALDPDETHDIRDIEKETISNDYFRKVLFTADRLQLVIMCLKPGEDIGEEVHPTTDQFFRIEEGSGKTVVDGKEINITDGSSILIKSGRVHNIINNSNKPLRLYSLYSPPQHRDGLIQKEK